MNKTFWIKVAYGILGTGAFLFICGAAMHLSQSGRANTAFREQCSEHCLPHAVDLVATHVGLRSCACTDIEVTILEVEGD